jgi:hypothetical protein
MRPELLAQNPEWIDNSQHAIVDNFCQGFVANSHSDFFRGQMDRNLIPWPIVSGKLGSLIKRK